MYYTPSSPLVYYTYTYTRVLYPIPPGVPWPSWRTIPMGPWRWLWLKGLISICKREVEPRTNVWRLVDIFFLGRKHFKVAKLQWWWSWYWWWWWWWWCIIDGDDFNVTTLVTAMTGPQSFKRPEAASLVVKHQQPQWSPQCNKNTCNVLGYI